MALSNWLTRNEWNACYFAGIKEKMDGKLCGDLGTHLRLGIGALHRSGYAFRGIMSTAEGDYEKVTQCCDGNESVLAEILDGSFDMRGRAKEVLAWTDGPKLDWSWLSDALKEAEASDSEET